MPLNAAALNALPKELASHDSAINNTVRQLAGAIGTAVIITIYTMQLSHVDITANEGFATAAGNTYVWMLGLAILSIVISLFVPNKVEKSKA